MSSIPAAAASALALFEPPYEQLTPCGPELIAELNDVDRWKGRAVVWSLHEESVRMAYFEALRSKAPGLPLLVLLPPPTEIRQILDMLPIVRGLLPKMILPHGLVDTASRLRQILALPPRGIASALTDYLARRGLLRRRKTAREFQRMVELAPQTRSISALSRRMYTSRRTLGRHFVASGLPVPSHCLQFARLLHVAVQLQADEGAMFRIASRFGYTDGFTMSNQMKRLIGYRPSEVRGLLGWEWIVEAWLKREGL